MIIVISTTDKNDQAQCDVRFGRAPYFAIYDTDTEKLDFMENKAVYADHGAGVQAAQKIVDLNADIVITGQVGPNAWQVLHSADITPLSGESKRVSSVISDYLEGKLEPIEKAGKAHRGRSFGRQR